MSKRRRNGKRAALPRITLLAYSKNDLQQFSDAVEGLRTVLYDLQLQIIELSNAVKGRGRKKAIDAPAEGPASNIVHCPKCKATFAWRPKCPQCSAPVRPLEGAPAAANGKDGAES